jgi:activator of HSP90 ATPase
MNSTPEIELEDREATRKDIEEFRTVLSTSQNLVRSGIDRRTSRELREDRKHGTESKGNKVKIMLKSHKSNYFTKEYKFKDIFTSSQKLVHLYLTRVTCPCPFSSVPFIPTAR